MLTANVKPSINELMASGRPSRGSNRVANLLAEGVKSTRYSRETGTRVPPNFHRVLGTLSTLGVIDEFKSGRFALKT